jgi:membrane peptidoglycan carboxypeptidase
MKLEMMHKLYGNFWRKKPKNFSSIGQLLAISTLFLGLILFIGGFPTLAIASQTIKEANAAADTLPLNLQTLPLPESTRILASDGTPIADLYQQNRVEVSIDQISKPMQDAIISIEDARFFDHNGIDLRGTLRAYVTNQISGGVVQGGSTLTQQYVKNTLVLSAKTPEEATAAKEKTISRKLREMRYALALERINTKEEILAGYLNIAYFGAGAHGVEAAAKRYFSKSAQDLTVIEAATIAGIVQQPTGFDPIRNPARNENRRNQVLDRMVSNGFLDGNEAEKLKKISVKTYLNPTPIRNGCTGSISPYFCDYVVQIIRNDPSFGESQEDRDTFLRESGATITTTLDLKAQEAAQLAVDKYIPRDDPSQKAAAISMVNSKTGEVIAMAQNRTWGTDGLGNTTYNYNVDAQHGGTAGMQAGSTFKVFTLLSALEQGYGPGTVLDSNTPKTFSNFTACEEGAPAFEPYTVNNSTRSGIFDMNQGLAYSVNTYFVGLEELTGLCRPAEIAEKLGVRTGKGQPLERVPSFTLGTAPVTPLMMASAVSVFANHGTHCPTKVISQIVTRDQEEIPLSKVVCSSVVDPGTADTAALMLTNVIDGSIEGRTGARMSLGREAGGKTGTTNDSAAVWFVGFTPDISAAVWVGDPRGGYKYPMKNITINGKKYKQVFGSSLPGPIWKEAMLGALDGTEATSLELQPSWLLTDKGIAPTFVPPAVPAPVPSP